MRLPEATIREVILHEDRLVRQEAVDYFTKSYSRDVSVMPLVIKAIEQYGRNKVLYRFDTLSQLIQSESTVAWTVAELNRVENATEDYLDYFPALSRLLCEADPLLTAPHEQTILQARGFQTDLSRALRERIEMLTWDAEKCWKELDEICTRAMSDTSGDMDFERGSRIVKALARQGQDQTERVLALLRHQVTDWEHDPINWMEDLVVELAGELRLEAAVPLVVAKLHPVRDFLSEACVAALVKIGTTAAANAVATGWAETDWDYRLYATEALEHIHSDASVQRCLELLPHEQYRDIKTALASALLSNFAVEGVDAVRPLVQQRAYDPQMADLKGQLVAVSTIIGVTFPEHGRWKREAEAEQARIERRIREMRSPAVAAPAPTARPHEDFVDRRLTPLVKEQKQVGRNDPCPCGSGKKFKKCCLNKGSR